MGAVAHTTSTLRKGAWSCQISPEMFEISVPDTTDNYAQRGNIDNSLPEFQLLNENCKEDATRRLLRAAERWHDVVATFVPKPTKAQFSENCDQVRQMRLYPDLDLNRC